MLPSVLSDVSYYINDIALIKLANPVRLSDHVNAVCLPKDADDFAGWADCEVMGWGSITSVGYRESAVLQLSDLNLDKSFSGAPP